MTRLSFHTELGLRENLEDSGQALIIRPLKSQAGEVAIFAVFDGVGGQDCGEIASQLAASQVTQSLSLFFSTWSDDPLGPQLPIDAITTALIRALERANQAIIQLSNEASETKAMATTANIISKPGSSSAFWMVTFTPWEDSNESAPEPSETISFTSVMPLPFTFQVKSWV